MRNRLAILLLSTLLLSGCATFSKQEGLPSAAQIDKWIDNDQYGLALTSLKHVSPNEKLFAYYVNKRKTIMVLAKSYEKAVLRKANKHIAQQKWSEAILDLNKALNNYPGSRLIHDRYNTVIEQQQRRIHKFDAKALLARAQLLSNKLPISQKDVSNSPINFAAQWDLQSLKSELSDMHNRLMAMTEQLIDDDEIKLAEMCIKQARLLPSEEKSITAINALQKRINQQKKIKQAAIKKKEHERKTRQKLSKQKKHSRKVRQLIKKVNHSLENNELVSAEKQLMVLARLAPKSNTFLELKLKHRNKVEQLVHTLIEKGNRLYRQEKIADAKATWETALRIDAKNKTLQAQIRRADRVLLKLKELRKKRAAARQ